MSDSENPEVEKKTEAVSSQNEASAADKSVSDSSASKSGETAEKSPPVGTGLTEDHVREALKEVIDPELFVNIVDLGLIYTVDIKSREDAKYDVGIEMTMTSPMCPAGPQLVGNSKQVVSALSEVEEVDVKVVMDPPWHQDMMSEDAKDKLNIF